MHPLRTLSVALLTAVVMSACGSSDRTASQPSSTPSTSPSSSATPATTPTKPKRLPTPAYMLPTNPCLITLKQAKAAFPLDWRMRKDSRAFCIYTSEEGAVIGLGYFPELEPRSMLKATRSGCVDKPQDLGPTAYLCLERADEPGRFNAQGYFMAKGRFWNISIVDEDRGDATAGLVVLTRMMRQVI